MEQDQTSTSSFWDKVSSEYTWGRDSARYGGADPRADAAFEHMRKTNSITSPDFSVAADIIGGYSGTAVGMVESVGDSASDLWHHLVD
jgi:hypothetical protein